MTDELGIRINHLRKTYPRGNVVACNDVHLEIERGELLVLLGPSGCGKTTTLRCVAGLERPDNEDAIWVNGKNITRLAPKDRHLAFVFQDTALFPHLDVRHNISFGLDMRRSFDRDEIERRVREAGRMLKIDHLLERAAHEVSGGQGQRVALGRAIVMEPEAFLLDEPLANLDAALRVEMRTEIKRIQRALGTTMIFVTHDQEEALTLGDKIAVMSEGVVQQVDTPNNIYLHPANLFVGTFIGSPPINRFDCELRAAGDGLRAVCDAFDIEVPPPVATRLDGDGQMVLGFRPELIDLGTGDGPVTGRVTLTELMGSRTLVYVDCGGAEIRVLVQGATGVVEGDDVSLAPRMDSAFYFAKDGQSMLG